MKQYITMIGKIQTACSDHSKFEFVAKIPGHDSYWASQDGKIYSGKSKMKKKQYIGSTGYYTVTLVSSDQNKMGCRPVHILMAKTWLDNPENLSCVNHKDGNKLNNRIWNLEYISRSGNTIHAFENNLIRRCNKPICQYDMKGVLMAEYKSLTDASLATGLKKSNICHACKGRYISTGGFVWRYKQDKDVVARKHRNSKGVEQYTLKGEFVNIYKSVRDAAKCTGCQETKIATVCRGKRKTTGGFIWKFQEKVPDGNSLAEKTKDWVELKQYLGYKISKDGEVYSRRQNIIMRSHNTGTYNVLTLTVAGKQYKVLVHRLVAMAYIPNKDNLPLVNHKDGNPLNNTVKNLEWCTHKENSLHASKIGRIAKRSVVQMKPDGTEIKTFESVTIAAKSIGRTPGAVCTAARNKISLCAGFRWKYA